MTPEKLNQLCAEQMGWKENFIISPSNYRYRWIAPDGTLTDFTHHYCTDLNAAITLLNALAKEWQIVIHRPANSSLWLMLIHKDSQEIRSANNYLPLAIVEVFLRARKVWEEEP